MGKPDSASYTITIRYSKVYYSMVKVDAATS